MLFTVKLIKITNNLYTHTSNYVLLVPYSNKKLSINEFLLKMVMSKYLVNV